MIVARNNTKMINNSDDINSQEMEKLDEEQDVMWRRLIHGAAYLRLKQSGMGLRLKVGCLL